MERSGGQVETAGVDEEVGSSLPHEHGQLRESEVIANANAHLAVFSVKDTNVLSSVEGFRFVVCDFPRDVDVKEMHFIVGGLQFSLGVDDEGSVEEFLVGSFSGDGSNGVHAILGGLLLDGVEGRRIREIFGKLDEVVLHVWGVAYLTKDGNVGSAFSGLVECF